MRRPRSKEQKVNAAVRSVGSYLPKKRLSNDDLSRTIDTSDEWIYSHTGIRARRIAADEEATSDLAVAAARQALDAGDFPAESLDLILVATATPDYNGFPSTASIVQERLHAANAAAMDLSAACTGFVYAVETASNFIRSGAARHVLVIGSEILSRVVDWRDRNTCVLFGDGAGAMLLSSEEGKRGVIRSFLRSEGKGAQYLCIPEGGSRSPFRAGATRREDLCLQMNGRKVYTFAVSAIGDTVETLLGSDVTLADLAYIVPHQANVRIIEAAAERFSIDISRFYVDIEEFANTSAASIPIAFAEMDRKGLLKKGDLILTVGFGAGLTYGGNLIRW